MIRITFDFDPVQSASSPVSASPNSFEGQGFENSDYDFKTLALLIERASSVLENSKELAELVEEARQKVIDFGNGFVQGMANVFASSWNAPDLSSLTNWQEMGAGAIEGTVAVLPANSMITHCATNATSISVAWGKIVTAFSAASIADGTF
jgi:Flp pilus assembly pilin Flp